MLRDEKHGRVIAPNRSFEFSDLCLMAWRIKNSINVVKFARRERQLLNIRIMNDLLILLLASEKIIETILSLILRIRVNLALIRDK